MPRPRWEGSTEVSARSAPISSAYATRVSPSKTPTERAPRSWLGRAQSLTMSDSSMETTPMSSRSWAAISSKTARASVFCRGRVVRPVGEVRQAVAATGRTGLFGHGGSVLPHVGRCRALIRALAARWGMSDSPVRPYRCSGERRPDRRPPADLLRPRPRARGAQGAGRRRLRDPVADPGRRPSRRCSRAATSSASPRPAPARRPPSRCRSCRSSTCRRRRRRRSCWPRPASSRSRSRRPSRSTPPT